MIHAPGSDAFREGVKRVFRQLRGLDDTNARMNFWCCQSCGWYSDECRSVGRFVFYHRQKHDAMMEGHPLYLHHGTDHGAEADQDFAAEIVAMFEAEGFTVTYNGNPRTCIQIDSLEVVA